MKGQVFFDTHNHLDDSLFDGCLNKVIEEAHHKFVANIICPAVHPHRFEKQLSVQQQFKGIHCAYGIHPWFIEHPEHELAALEAWMNKLESEGIRCVAIGEIGLDFRPNLPAKEIQLDLFEAQLNIAQARGLPAIIHAVKSLDTGLSMLKKTPVSFVIHSFNGSADQATKIIEQNGMMGLSGQILRAGHKLIQAIKQTPLEHLLIETDAPDQNVFDNKPINEPANLVYVAAKLAEIKGISVEEVARQTTINAKQFFNIQTNHRF